MISWLLIFFFLSSSIKFAQMEMAAFWLKNESKSESAMTVQTFEEREREKKTLENGTEYDGIKIWRDEKNEKFYTFTLQSKNFPLSFILNSFCMWLGLENGNRKKFAKEENWVKNVTSQQWRQYTNTVAQWWECINGSFCTLVHKVIILHPQNVDL